MLLQRYPYLPLVPQIQQLYRRAGNSAQLALRAERKTDVMESLWDSPGWKAAVFDSGFSRERRNIALSMSTDGVNPFKKMQYSSAHVNRRRQPFQEDAVLDVANPSAGAYGLSMHSVRMDCSD